VQDVSILSEWNRFDLLNHRDLLPSSRGAVVAMLWEMILTLAALLLQFPTIPQNLDSRTLSSAAEATVAAPETAPKTAMHAPESADLNPEPPAAEDLIPNSNLPARDSHAAALSLSPRSGSQDRSEKQRSREWLALSIAQHGAATFDAWSTRQAISTGQYRELNPALRPFAGNASLYAAIQVCPLVFDYVGRRMMTSQHGWLRHTWWIPQALSTAMSLGSGVHNLSAH
jgi:hypothetical protein